MSDLNPQQLQAVNQIYGPVLLVAGPGTGKTQTLALRIKNILQQTDANPNNILCITYTDAGVIAMRERLKKHIGDAAYKVGIYTFHGFCNEIISKYSELFPRFSSRPTQVSGLAQFKALQQVLNNLPEGRLYSLKQISQPYKNIGLITSRISSLKQENITPSQFSNLINLQLEDLESNPINNKKTGKPTTEYTKNLDQTKRLQELALIYEMYEDHLLANNQYDYNDMISEVIVALQQNPSLMSDLQEQYQYMLVDEYQDTNGAQNKIIKLLTSGVEQPNVFAVGDDDQAIFKFQGASVYHMLNFTKDFDSAVTIPLTTSYRSTQPILNLAMDSIHHNSERLINLSKDLNKNLTSALSMQGQLPSVQQFENYEQEVDFIVKQIKAEVDAGKNPSEIAIIYAQHKDAEDLIDALLKAQIPINVKAGGDALKELPVVQLLQLLQVLLQNPHERNYLLSKVLLHPYWDVNMLDVFKLIRYSNDVNYKDKFKSTQLLDVILNHDALNTMGLESPEKLGRIGKMLVDFFSMQQSLGLYSLALTVLEKSGMLNLIKQNYYTVEQINALTSILDFIKTQQQLNPGISLQDLFNDLGTAKEYNLKVLEQDLKTAKFGVNLLTAHGSKGLEFDTVYIYKCINGKWGNKKDTSGIKLPGWVFGLDYTKEELKDAADQEARRLFFVAITRAKQNLIITYSTSYADSKEAQASSFITELDSKLLNIKSHTTLEVGIPDLVNKLTITPKLVQNETDFLQEQLQDFKLSPSNMKTYIDCPLNFKYDCLYRFPTLPSTDAAMGTALHSALQTWGEYLMQGKQINLDILIHKINISLERELLSYEQLNDLQLKSAQIMQEYYESYKDSFITPEQVEYNFSRHQVMFPIPDQEPVQLTGKIDKVEMVNPEKLEVRLVDYKSGAEKSLKAIMGETKNSDDSVLRQLAFYCLMSGLDPNFKPKNNFKNYHAVSTRVDYIKVKSSIEVNITEEYMEHLKAEIVFVVKAIRNLEFSGSEKYPLCGKCDSCLALEQQLLVS